MLAISALLQTPENLLRQVDAKRLRATVEKLASWHDRNTNNPTLTEAAEWIASELRKSPNLQVELMRYPVQRSARIKEDKEVVQVVAVLPGATDRRIIIGGHFDTINMRARGEGASWTAPSPGANDDASGTANMMELARIMSSQKWNQTMVFVAFSGEEQGLLGSTALARRAKQEGWKVDAVFSSDICGSSKNANGQSDPNHIRLFSDEVAPGARNAQGAAIPSHNSRELARYIEFATRRQVGSFGAKLVFRADRFGRGGDHTPFNREGFTAVRFTEPHEEYSRQHSEDDLPKHMDFGYLANVTRLQLVALMQLANAQEPPTNVRVDRGQGHDTRITWEGPVTSEYIVYWRETTSPVWQATKRVGPVTRTTIEKVSKDDTIFAVGAVGGIPVEAR